MSFDACMTCLQVMELSNARKALASLVEEDADGYAITAAIDHAKRVGVDSEVRLIIETVETGLIFNRKAA
jgi:hypothetical protein